jgi:hypothetical protein
MVGVGKLSRSITAGMDAGFARKISPGERFRESRTGVSNEILGRAPAAAHLGRSYVPRLFGYYDEKRK